VPDVATGKKLSKKLAFRSLLKLLRRRGKGMRIVWSEEEFEHNWDMARNEAKMPLPMMVSISKNILKNPDILNSKLLVINLGVLPPFRKGLFYTTEASKIGRRKPSPFMTPELREKDGCCSHQSRPIHKL
jgi:acetyl-CoA carboxylase biotin carboxylase subunit